MNLHSNEHDRGFPDERAAAAHEDGRGRVPNARVAGLCDGWTRGARRMGRDNPDENLFLSGIWIV
ncbi:hypothetical protein [Burkholderia seminalis]|uniref:hypothetical protein n=1 Tax=Burkholderia seminalis TaxID=488731 RepID=UPI000F5983F2|nr:hypothetical protein [Burkholderia seminalis]